MEFWSPSAIAATLRPELLSEEARPIPLLTLQQTCSVVVLFLALLMLPLAPLTNPYCAPGVLLFLAVAFGTRNILAIAATAALLNLAVRLFLPGSGWHDQHWVQWSSISSLLTGHNIFSTSPLYQFSLSSYMPAADLFGGFFIALGIQRYWLVWHVLVVCLTALPLVLTPSFYTLLIFIGFSSFYPFVDYTTGGGTLEISYALMIGAIALFRAQGNLLASLVLLAFAIMFRQPAIVMVPFILLILWQESDSRRINLFGILLFFFGGIYILASPAGAYRYLYKEWEGYHQELFNAFQGLRMNHSISSLPRVFGISDSVAWYDWRSIYGPLTLLGVTGLFSIAWFKKNREEILMLGVLASAAVYILARGYTQFGYVCSAFFPLVAFAYPLNGPEPVSGRRFAQIISLLLVWIGATPAVLFMSAWTVRQFEEVRPARIFHALDAHTVETPSVSLGTMDGTGGSTHLFPISATVQFQLPSSEYITAIRLSCGQIPIQNIKDVFMPFPTEQQMRGVITEGIVEGSENGHDFLPIQHFYNAVNYCIWPGKIFVPKPPRPLLAIRLHPVCLYLDQKEWILGNVEFLAAPSVGQ